MQQALMKALTSKETGAVGVIAGSLVALFGMAPSAAAIVAALLVKLIVVPAAEVLCEQWEVSISNSLAKIEAVGRK
jgi:hypothetical protein